MHYLSGADPPKNVKEEKDLNIAGVSGYYSAIALSQSVRETSGTQGTSSQVIAALVEGESVVETASGDTAELSFSGVMLARGMSPMMAGGPPGKGMKDLVDKVADGTATDDEVQELASALQEMAARMQEHAGDTSKAGSPDSEMQDLMTKVLDGSATEDDIKAIATKMQQMAGQGGRPLGPPPMGQPPAGQQPLVTDGNTYYLARR